MYAHRASDEDRDNYDEAPRRYDNGRASLKKVRLSDMPETHPVRRFAGVHARLTRGALIPHEDEIFQSEEACSVLPWSKHIEPIELQGVVDFKVLSQGERLAERERRNYSDQWMSETVDPEFVEARYSEVIAASVLRKPMFSRGAVPSRQRAFINVLRGVFPVFAENRARLRLFEIAAEPYVETEFEPSPTEG